MTIAGLPNRAINYRRVSTPGQTGERHCSLETQEAHYNELCQRRGLAAVTTFTDVVSGRRDDRKEYQRMVEFVKSGGADVVIVQYLDRFGRNPREILRRYWELEEHGVKVVATDEDITEEIMLLIKAGMAGAESKRTSERVRANMGRAVAKGVHAARPPYGLRPIREIKEGKVSVHWEIDQSEALLVKEMYRLAVEDNLGFKGIADRLTQQGHRARGGRPFASFTVQRILTNPALMGTLTYGKRPRKGNPQVEAVQVRDFFPAILKPEEWQALQDRFKIRQEAPRGQSHASVYLLSGIARCGHCGGPMAGKAGAAYKGKRYRNYYCSRAVHGRGLCPEYNGHSAPKLEKAIIEYLGQFSHPDLVREHLAAMEKRELERYEAELQRIDKRLKDFDAQFLARLDDLLKRKVLNEEEFARANESARTEAAALENRKADLMGKVQRERNKASVAERVPQQIKSFLEAFQSLDVRQQKAHLQAILKAAHVYKDGRIEVDFRE